MFLKKNIISFVLSASIHSLVLAYIVYDEKFIRSDTSMTVVNLVEIFPTSQLNTNSKIDNNISSTNKVETKQLKTNQLQNINYTSINDVNKKKIQKYDIEQIVNNSQDQIKSKFNKEININTNITSPTSKNIKSRAKYKIGTIENPHPEYPIIARKKGWQGRLLLAVHIDKNGNVLNVHVKETSGFEVLDKVSVKTIRDWKFLPARHGDSNVEDNINIPVSFKLIN
ncbi:MAG: energy transducer TonB [Alphaproteobacteria bacterium]